MKPKGGMTAVTLPAPMIAQYVSTLSERHSPPTKTKVYLESLCSIGRFAESDLVLQRSGIIKPGHGGCNPVETVGYTRNDVDPCKWDPSKPGWLSDSGCSQKRCRGAGAGCSSCEVLR